MKNRGKIISVVALLAIVIGFSACQNMAQKFLELTVNQYDKQCPVQLNDFVRIDKCEAAPGLTIKFSATMLLLQNADDVDFQQTAITKAAKSRIIRELQNDPRFGQVKKFGIKYQYSYFDSAGNHLYDISVTPDDYNNPLPEDTDEDIVKGMIASSKLEVQTMQKQLPMDMGNGLSLTAVRFIEDEKTNEYTITLQGIMEETAKADINIFMDNTKPEMVNSLENSSITLPYLKYGFVFRYIYNDSKGKYLCTINISNDDILAHQ